jgi:hypothetical protein
LSKLRFWEHPTSSGEKMEKHSGMGGQVIVYRQTEIIEFLHVFDVELTLSKFLPAKKIRTLVAKRIEVDPEEILMLKKIEIRLESITYYLVKIGPDSEVLADSKWLQFPTMMITTQLSTIATTKLRQLKQLKRI